MAINFNSFTEGTTSNIQSNDYVVGFDNTNPGGERKWTVSTIANAVSGITNLNRLSNASAVNGIVKCNAGNFSAAVAGTDYLTSATLESSPSSVKAWVNFNGNISINSSAIVQGSYNVSSVVRQNNAGSPDSSVIYRINFATAMSSTRYAVMVCGQIGGPDGNGDDQIGGNRGIQFQTSTYCEVGIRDPQASNEVSSSVSVLVVAE